MNAPILLNIAQDPRDTLNTKQKEVATESVIGHDAPLLRGILNLGFDQLDNHICIALASKPL